MAKSKSTEIGGESPTNGAKRTIESLVPYSVSVELTGVSDMLFHAWNCESVDAKATAAKGSKAKKTDDIESYVYRNDAGELCVPGSYLRGSILGAARFLQDPRSPRKSAQDLYKAGVVVVTPLASLGIRDWDYEHRGRVTVQRSAVTRTRPAIKAGWKATFEVAVLLPGYIPPDTLHAVLIDAGRLVGLADFRPSFGRFNVSSFQVMERRSQLAA